jgi:hypothetical protein
MKDRADVTTPVGGRILSTSKTPFRFNKLTGNLGRAVI